DGQEEGAVRTGEDAVAGRNEVLHAVAIEVAGVPDFAAEVLAEPADLFEDAPVRAGVDQHCAVRNRTTGPRAAADSKVGRAVAVDVAEAEKGGTEADHIGRGRQDDDGVASRPGEDVHARVRRLRAREGA